MRNLLILASLLLCAGCGRTTDTATPAPQSDFAAPVLAPMQARERLLEDLEQQQQQARDRSAMFDDAAGRGN